MALSALLAVGAMHGAAVAHARPGSGPTAAVSMGDSFISGQAGRWFGNSVNTHGDRDGTDRACVRSGSGCSRYDKSRVYVGASAFNGCHRSNVAEILTAAIPVAQRINLACSGGVNANLLRASRGGRDNKGEPPQGDQLAAVARSHDVRLVVIASGGNDLGFSDIVLACILRYAELQGPCRPTEEPGLAARLPIMRAGLLRVVDEVRSIMRTAGYKPWHYRLVLQSYPSPIPRAREMRYPEAGPTRGVIGNCPMYDSDLDWARDDVLVRISNVIGAVATIKGVQFLELRDSFQGREMCSVTTAQASAGHPPNRIASEWARFAGLTSITAGDYEESFHPSAFGQIALGRCLTLTFARPTGSFACHNRPGTGPEGMALRQVSRSPGRHRMRIRVRPRRAIAGRRTCFRIYVISQGRRVERALVRFAGRRKRTGRRGAVRRCVRLRKRTYLVRVRREGFYIKRAPVRPRGARRR